MKRILATGLLVGALAAGPDAASGQQPQQNFLAVGTTAPDISFAAATRYGALGENVPLSRFRGQTVVLAFFFRARTPG